MHKTKYLMIQDALKKALAMVLFIVLARYLTVEDFGQYQQLILISGLISIFCSAGIPVAVSYFYGQAKRYSNKVSLFKRFFFLQLFLLFSGASLFLMFDEILAQELNNTYIEELSYLVVIILITNSSIEFFKNLSAVSNKLKSYLYSTTTIQLISVISSVVVVVVTQNIIYILLVTVLFNTVLFLLLIRNNLKYFFVSTNECLISKREFRYIVAMASVALVSVLNGYIDQIMVSIMLSAEEYANLKIGAFQIPFIAVITGSLLTAMIPVISKLFSEKNTEEIIETWRLSMEKASVLLVPIVIFCLVFAEEIIIGFFGGKFEAAIIVFQIYMIQWLRAVVIFGGVMGAIGLEKHLFKNTLIIAVLNLVLNYLMILEFGIIGAAITTTFLNYFGAFLLIKDIDKTLNKSFFDYFPVRVYFISLLVSAFTAVTLKWLLGDGSSILVVIFLSTVFYFLVMVAQLKLFYKEISIKAFKELF